MTIATISTDDPAVDTLRDAETFLILYQETGGWLGDRLMRRYMQEDCSRVHLYRDLLEAGWLFDTLSRPYKVLFEQWSGRRASDVVLAYWTLPYESLRCDDLRAAVYPPRGYYEAA
jgi:hypothetical protein